MLADYLTVLENVILGSEPVKFGGRIDVDSAVRTCVRSAMPTV
ncbi:MAG: hypothetical protein R2706_20875 [Acidimicrobiales bacterium]